MYRNPKFERFWSEEGEDLATVVEKTQANENFDVEFSVAMGITLTEIGLGSGTILKLGAVHHYLKFN